jgi:hypothetical protein
MQDREPAIDGALVQEFVVAGHGDLNKVKAMLSKTPSLLNACWDWGGGDFETAIGGAGHMGNKDIANYLLSQGARADTFVFAMLDDVSVLSSILASFPSLRESLGPHGISLRAHAERGQATGVLALLDGQ